MKGKTAVLFFSALVPVIVTSLRNPEIGYHPEFMDGDRSALGSVYAYPPAVGILSNSKNCLSCHVNNGPWNDDQNTIIDILDRDTKASLRQTDGTFLIEAKSGEPKTVLTVIGSKKNNLVEAPYRNAWLYIDPSAIGTNRLSKFPPGWEVNLPMSCRIVGDELDDYDNADITTLPMTIMPGENAKDSELSLQVMLTKGESAKGNAQSGMTGSYFERKVKLKLK